MYKAIMLFTPTGRAGTYKVVSRYGNNKCILSLVFPWHHGIFKSSRKNKKQKKKQEHMTKTAHKNSLTKKKIVIYYMTVFWHKYAVLVNHKTNLKPFFTWLSYKLPSRDVRADTPRDAVPFC